MGRFGRFAAMTGQLPPAAEQQRQRKGNQRPRTQRATATGVIVAAAVGGAARVDRSLAWQQGAAGVRGELIAVIATFQSKTKALDLKKNYKRQQLL